MIFEPLRSRRSFEEIAAQIRRIIVDGALEPGARLPSEKELARQFEVGRQAVREALRLLEGSGLIKIKKGNDGGTFISAFNAKNMSDSISNIFSLGNISTKDIAETRFELEKILLIYAIDRMTEDDIAALEASINRAQEGLNRGEVPLGENLEFHLILARATRNYMFVVLMESVLKVFREFIAEAGLSVEPASCAVNEHRSMLELIKKKKVPECVDLMARHLGSFFQMKNGPTRNRRARQSAIRGNSRK